jgi:hypothetical protein
VAECGSSETWQERRSEAEWSSEHATHRMSSNLGGGPGLAHRSSVLILIDGDAESGQEVRQ